MSYKYYLFNKYWALWIIMLVIFSLVSDLLSIYFSRTNYLELLIAILNLLFISIIEMMFSKWSARVLSRGILYDISYPRLFRKNTTKCGFLKLFWESSEPWQQWSWWHHGTNFLPANEIEIAGLLFMHIWSTTSKGLGYLYNYTPCTIEDFIHIWLIH